MAQTPPETGRIQPIGRESLRGRIQDVIIGGILSGSLPPGSRINESQLAKSLDVSQTPVREALLGLEGQGFVVAQPARGFFVKEFSEREVRDIYPVLADLEALALEAAGIPPSQTLDRLDRINAELDRAAGRPDRAIDVDDQFHTCLLSGCPNTYLLRLVGQTRRATYRYEYAYMGERDLLCASSNHHRGIVVSLRGGDLEAAVRTLRHVWLASVDDVLRWLARIDQLDAKGPSR
ncbi:MAG: GntR family transcriptional regulator [Candidatus Krumholzibacteria bacterium]|nr:GntR family transcriptional regulator [Candidatus Krumholzibacteria bacterium]